MSPETERESARGNHTERSVPDALAFFILLRDPDDAAGLARLLDDVRVPEPVPTAIFAAPDVRGTAFFRSYRSDWAVKPVAWAVASWR
jgi:hypothetical protein